jgi:squalene-hopene/tetraprenyl-beta-curcumene cyclase
MTNSAKIALAAGIAVAAVAVMAIGLVGAGLVSFWHYSRVEHQTLLATARAAEAEQAQQEAAKAAVAAPSAEAKALAERRQEAMARGTAYVLKEQGEDGSWGKGNAGITSLCLRALLAVGKPATDPAVKKGLDFLLKSQKPDGGIYGDADLKTYTSSIACSVLVKADPKTYAETIEKVKGYLIKTQWDEEESIDKANPWYGGHGYGKHERPDLSNTQFFVQAMHDAGVPKDNPLWAKLTVFLSRCQDRSESNDKTFVGRDDGGFVYAPTSKEGPESKAGTVDLPDGRKGLRSYGSMTYAGFKSFMYAGLKRDDPRVVAAMEWIRKHWTFEENPEMGQQGLYYYYMTAARALAAYSKATGEDKVTDARRRSHDWRTEISEAILARQRPDGTWVNTQERWYEGEQMAIVPTSYCLIALAECK